MSYYNQPLPGRRGKAKATKLEMEHLIQKWQANENLDTKLKNGPIQKWRTKLKNSDQFQKWHSQYKNGTSDLFTRGLG